MLALRGSYFDHKARFIARELPVFGVSTRKTGGSMGPGSILSPGGLRDRPQVRPFPGGHRIIGGGGCPDRTLRDGKNGIPANRASSPAIFRGLGEGGDRGSPGSDRPLERILERGLPEARGPTSGVTPPGGMMPWPRSPRGTSRSRRRSSPGPGSSPRGENTQALETPIKPDRGDDRPHDRGPYHLRAFRDRGDPPRDLTPGIRW